MTGTADDSVDSLASHGLGGSSFRRSTILVGAAVLLGVQCASFVLSSVLIFIDYPPPWLVYQPGIGVLLLTPFLWVMRSCTVYFLRRRRRLSLRVSILCGIVLVLEPVATVLGMILIPAGVGPFD